MGDTANGSWGSRELGGYIRREERRAMDRHERAAEARATEHAAADALIGLGIVIASGLVSLGLALYGLHWLLGKIGPQ